MALLRLRFARRNLTNIYHKKGFTLVELMIVIAIIAFLSMVSVPHLMKFLAKAKRSEAYLYLRTLAQAERAHFMEHGAYTKKLGGAQGLGWRPEGAFYYSYGFADGAEGVEHFVGSAKTAASSLAGATVSKEGFVIYAAGQIYGDKPDVLSIDQNNVIKVVSDGLS